jgi:hypothetical protein
MNVHQLQLYRQASSIYTRLVMGNSTDKGILKVKNILSPYLTDRKYIINLYNTTTDNYTHKGKPLALEKKWSKLNPTGDTPELTIFDTKWDNVHHFIDSQNTPARDDWAEIKYDVMCVAVYHMFTQHPPLKNLLLLTRDRPLICDDDDDKGWCGILEKTRIILRS